MEKLAGDQRVQVEALLVGRTNVAAEGEGKLTWQWRETDLLVQAGREDGGTHVDVSVSLPYGMLLLERDLLARVDRAVAERCDVSGELPPAESVASMTQTPRDPQFEQRVRASFDRQAVMATLGATLVRVTPGEVVVDLPFRPELTQQHGFLHAGVVTTVMDSACGYAALSLMEPGAAVLTIEFKVNLLAPARGDGSVRLGALCGRGGP